MRILTLMMATLAAFSLTACESLNNAGTKQTVGAGAGALIGGILGSKVGDGNGQLFATGIGTLLGGLVGSEIGRSLDKADMVYAQRANYEAHSAPIGESISWNNPDSGNSGEVTPVRDGSDTGGRYCREYQQTIYVGGQQETGYGIACQQPDGSWEIVG
ncbi:MAG: RT0821/Lpp0805 family surface protein [Pseudomonadota bacterium]